MLEDHTELETNVQSSIKQGKSLFPLLSNLKNARKELDSELSSFVISVDQYRDRRIRSFFPQKVSLQMLAQRVLVSAKLSIKTKWPLHSSKKLVSI